ncbi:hypothetical protein AYI70_g112 [Smittium culicis]|uniref:Uncharacterized protein n=1 Tax=Smittium culicis TaxID=133412 RepID=A0A1R1YHV7_9FUNG|nr:hypothetical protein AYI70_g112 [Smittium culicis]
MGKSHPRGVKAPLRNDLSSHIEAHPYEELANGFDHIPSHSSLGNASKQSHSNSSGAHGKRESHTFGSNELRSILH